MRKRILSLALALILILVMVPAAFATETVEIGARGMVGAALTKVISTSDTPYKDWHEGEEYGYSGDDNVKTYFCEAAPVTLSTAFSYDYWWDDAEVATQPTETEDIVGVNITMTQAGTYLFVLDDGDIAFYVVVGGDSAPAPATFGQTVNPTASTVYVNGTAKAFEAYTIDGNNYFKLRDLAAVLGDTEKQFEVGYDNDTKAITLTSSKPYTSVGGELVAGDGNAKTSTPTASKIYMDGNELSLTVYTIGGNNFFKLRDLMQAIDIFVGYDNATKNITLDTSKGYVAE